ncbi:MAG: hypothetical protein ACO1PB_07070 [Ramlibacter sp.]
MEPKQRQTPSRRRSTAAAPCEIEATAAARPLRALFQHLNQSEPSPYGRQRIAEHAATSMRLIHLGLGAMGHLLAQSAVQVEERTIPSEAVESLGRLMAELGELAAFCHELCAEGELAGSPITVQERVE